MEILASFWNLVPVTLVQGLLFGLVALGVMIPFRLLAFPDLTSEGSFPLGGCLCAVLIVAGMHPLPATLAALAAGMLAGLATAFIHLRLRINTLLAGILVMTILYSVNLRVDSLARAVDDAAAAGEAAVTPPCASRALHLLVPPEGLERFIDEAQARCDEWRVDVQGVDVRLTLAEEETFLRWARKPYTEVALRLSALATIGGAVRDTQLRRELIDTAIAAGGSFPIGRTPDATREQVTACYPELPEFLAEKRRVDPSEKLVNGWYLHHRSLFSRDACETRWNQA